MNNAIKKMNGNQSGSALGETYAELFHATISSTERLSQTLNAATTVSAFPNSGIGRQLEQVARIIPTTRELGTERAGFFVQQAQS